jgi:mRNA-degrading endonuclease RelE of RelBE toxin-antitoxin system
MYKITIKKSAAKELNELPNKIAMLITSAIYQLAEIQNQRDAKN